MIRFRPVATLMVCAALVLPLAGCKNSTFEGQYATWWRTHEDADDQVIGRYKFWWTVTPNGDLFDLEAVWAYSFGDQEDPVPDLMGRASAVAGLEESGWIHSDDLAFSGELTDCLGNPVGTFDFDGGFHHGYFANYWGIPVWEPRELNGDWAMEVPSEFPALDDRFYEAPYSEEPVPECVDS